MKKVIKLLMPCLLMLVFCGCASIVSKSEYSIKIDSVPSLRLGYVFKDEQGNGFHRDNNTRYI
jgi:hypothetical protein